MGIELGGGREGVERNGFFGEGKKGGDGGAYMRFFRVSLIECFYLETHNLDRQTRMMQEREKRR